MFPNIYCVHDTQKSPKQFILNKDTEYVCHIDEEDDTFHQLLFFTNGEWSSDYSDTEAHICLNGDAGRILGTLTKSHRCFLWSKAGNQENLSPGEKIKLSISFKGAVVPTTTRPLPFSSPVSNKLTEGQMMKKTNETTPSVVTASNQKSKKEDKESTVLTDSTHSNETPVKQSRNKKNEMATTPSDDNTSTRSKKRQLEKENSGLTPKLKTARCRASFGNTKTPPSKRAVEFKETLLNESVCPVADNNDKTKIVRCVALPSRVPRPSSRWGHSMCMVDERNAVLIGGQGDKMQLSKDSIWQLDTESRSWKSTSVTTEGVRPENRTGHSATYDPTMRCIYVFGGSKNSKWFHDVHMYDLDAQKWSLIKANGKAPTRAYHSAALYRHELWVFGGVFPRPVPQPDGCDNELHIFSPVMEGWYKPIVTGEKPEPRSGHSANVVDDRMVVFGGWDFPICFSDLHILDLTTLDWSRPKSVGEPPKPRCWASSSTITNRRVFIHGGYDGDNPLADAFIFSLDTYSWQQLTIDKAPSPRAGHACIRIWSRYDKENEDEIIIFGGGDNDDTFFSDMYSFYVPFTPSILD